MKVLVDYGLRGSTLPGWLRVWLGKMGLNSSPAEIVILAAFLGIGGSGQF